MIFMFCSVSLEQAKIAKLGVEMKLRLKIVESDGFSQTHKQQRATCIKGLFWPPYEAEKLKLFHIDLLEQ